MLVFAHRGGKALGPENTIGTAQKSMRLEVDGIEIDVRASINREPVVIHDATIDRTTNSTGYVKRMSRDSLASFDAGNGEGVPSLAKMLDAFAHTNAIFLLDLKDPKAAISTAELIHHFIVNRGYSPGRLIVISRLHQLLVLVRDKFPKVITGATLTEIPGGLAASGEYTNSKYLLPSIDILTPELAQDAHERNLKLIPWVCDTQEHIAHAHAMRAYGVISSDPAFAVEVCRKY